MKNLYLYILLLLLCVIPINAQLLTDEQLFQIVKNFENNQNLFGFKVLHYNDYEEVVLENTNNDKSWKIDHNSNIICYINYNEHENDKINFVYSIEECKNFCLNYLNSKNINILGFQIQEPAKLLKGCYSFYFFKILDTNIPVLSENSFAVEVNKKTGNIACFYRNIGIDYIPTSSLTLTDSVANSIVQNIIGNDVSNYITTVAAYNPEYNAITRNIMIDNFGWLTVDAISCNILNTSPYLNVKISDKIKNNIRNYNKSHQFIKNSLKIKTLKNDEEELINILSSNKEINFILFDTENSKDVKYTVIPTGFEIDKEDKGIARMEVNGKKFIFRNGSYWCFINNKTYNIGGNCIIKDGILQLPEDFYKKVQTKDYDFFPKSQNSITK